MLKVIAAACMAKLANLFSVLSLDVDSDGGVGEKDDQQEESLNPMPAGKMHRSKKKRRKPKKEDSTESLQIASLSIHEETQQHKVEPSPITSLPLANIPATSLLNSSAHNGGLSDSLKWPLVWIDLEMTGLDLEKDRILEIACIITDGKLQETFEGPDLIIHQNEQLLTSMGEWCQTHHAANGLIEAVRNSKITEKEAEDQVIDFVRKHTRNEAKPPLLAGNCVYVDLMFLKKYMPQLASLFPHRVVDVSSINALCRRWFPKDAERAPIKKKSHRAMDDIKESIAELKYMQKTIFKQSKK
ncbi:hypothetical protein KP509_17G062800 [Ceratopteris richardii]|uniref:Exonuclease domain-containing protein n=1 Tax=Ceratopteris richardii TaxID=49495 RepID=A0A8T2SYV7_CERRI|nr:hypothetical protein KP509_17G062800 [Ceratopteris richardii]